MTSERFIRHNIYKIIYLSSGPKKKIQFSPIIEYLYSISSKYNALADIFMNKSL